MSAIAPLLGDKRTPTRLTRAPDLWVHDLVTTFSRCQRGEVEEISLVSKMKRGQLENEADVEHHRHVMTAGVKSACFAGGPCFKPIVQTGNEPARISAG
jgi:hypothetical protein